MKEKIIELLCEIKKDRSFIEVLTDDSDIINEVGLDSLQMINFILRIEDEFNIEIDFEEFDIENLKNINGLCSYISKNQGE